VKKLLVVLAVWQAGCGAGTVLLPLPLPIPIFPVTASLVPLEGQWVLSDGRGGRSCLVIQESRVSILDLACSNNGLGLVARILEAPVITRSGPTIVLSVTFNPKTGDETLSKLVFVGQLQADGTFVGTRRDETTKPPNDDVKVVELVVVELVAILSRL